MRFLIDECLHASLVGIAGSKGHEAHHVTWLGLGGASDRALMRRIVSGDFTFVTNNGRDFLKLYARQPLHAGLVIIVPQVAPAVQRELFDGLLDALAQGGEPINEAIEIRIEGNTAIIDRYDLTDRTWRRS